MPKPGDFFMGVLDFFAILLPGAIATALLAQAMNHPIVDGSAGASVPVNTTWWVLFVAVAYVFGHLVFFAGSLLDRFYQARRKWFSNESSESAHDSAQAIRDTFIMRTEAPALNTYQWCRAVLIGQCPAAAADVQRLEADSKLFRSLSVIFAGAALVLLFSGQIGTGLAAAVLALLSIGRYGNRRAKSNTQAYVHVITLHRLGALGAKKSGMGA